MTKFTAFFYVLILIGGCSAKSDVTRRVPPFREGCGHAVVVINHGRHTGLAVPGEAIRNVIPELKTHLSDAAYIEFGWGDRAFYRAGEPTSGLAARAVFWPTDPVIRAVAVSGLPRDEFSGAEAVTLCAHDRELAALLKYIEGSFYRDEAVGKLVDLGAGSNEDDRFYRAVGDYYLTNTCNTWTAKGLKSMGLDISTAFQIGSGGIMKYLERHIPDTTAQADISCKNAASLLYQIKVPDRFSPLLHSPGGPQLWR
jgi:uncharacterized protein (TIGR02117 family)